MANFKYEAIQLDGNGWRIEENGVRSFLFTGTDGALLIDSGYGSGDLLAAVRGLTELPVRLVNTHADGDHIGCNRQFESVYMHPSEFDYYNGHKEYADHAALPVWEGEKIDLGGRRFEVILIPGHTPGSIALLDRERRVLISGDSVSEATIYMCGPGRNIHAYIKSMEKLLAMRGAFDEIYPSHGPFPVKPEILVGLVEGAKLMRDGKIPPRDADFETSAKVYDTGTVRFLR